MDKHYTPDLTEFHLGFIFEHKYKDHPVIVDGWGPALVTEGSKLENFQDLINEDRIRVKHLDREDIKGEDWTFDIEADKALLFQKEGNFRRGEALVSILYNPISHWLLVWYGDKANNSNYIVEYQEGSTHIHTTNVLFAGKIKNLSEFRRILKQIGV